MIAVDWIPRGRHVLISDLSVERAHSCHLQKGIGNCLIKAYLQELEEIDSQSPTRTSTQDGHESRSSGEETLWFQAPSTPKVLTASCKDKPCRQPEAMIKVPPRLQSGTTPTIDYCHDVG